MQNYLAVSYVIDFSHPKVREVAAALRSRRSDEETIGNCFYWVRDSIIHSFDADECDVVTCKASDVLKHRTGICYAKSHLLCALLRANKIPAALGYQRLLYDEEVPTYCLHGFNFVFLEKTGWLAIDARGTGQGFPTEFLPPKPSFAFPAEQRGERTYPNQFANPLPVVVDTLTSAQSVEELKTQLPDW